MLAPDLDQRIDRVRAELVALAARPEVRDAFRTLDDLEHTRPTACRVSRLVSHHVAHSDR